MKVFFSKAKIPFSVYIFVFFLILLAGLLNIVLHKPSTYSENKEAAISSCVKMCEIELALGRSLTNGPCLSQEIEKGWACDVENKPKIKIIDGDSLNQCESYSKGSVKHIVKVTPKCDLISSK